MTTERARHVECQIADALRSVADELDRLAVDGAEYVKTADELAAKLEAAKRRVQACRQIVHSRRPR